MAQCWILLTDGKWNSVLEHSPFASSVHLRLLFKRHIERIGQIQGQFSQFLSRGCRICSRGARISEHIPGYLRELSCRFTDVCESFGIPKRGTLL